MLYSLRRPSALIVCAITLISLATQGTSLNFPSTLRQRQRGLWGPSLDTATQTQKFDPRAVDFDRKRSQYVARLALDEPTEDRAGDVELNKENDKELKPSIPSGHGLRRVLGDLETCAEDLLPYSSSSEAEQTVMITGSKVRSCREAIFSIVRWVKAQREEILKPRERYAPIWSSSLPDHPYKEALDKWKGTFRKRGWIPEASRCEATVCRVKDLHFICSSSRRKSPENMKLCRMCYPPNDDLINMHCAKQDQRLRNVLYLLLGFLVAIGGGAAIVFCVRKAKERRQRPRPFPQQVGNRGGIGRRFIEAIRKSRRLTPVQDLERSPGGGSNGVFLRTIPSQNISKFDISTIEAQMHEKEEQASPLHDSLKLRMSRGSRPTTPASWR
ncbi:hypothetical protein AJ79_01324 [Helicocarpus griseus UAMH5409]|uniref:Ig-like domain-containing protein n=1 Tax=Helicocarpus griseus UAMH5409 TaxID=1447875 RepID=A0A2B7Y6M7_9EURO|nr:hypothetical protein AJ79_01324 [Helicocarpus griseus UAMH5409]